MLDENTTNSLIKGLKDSGAKLTAQRLAICDWLHNNADHPTAADTYDALSVQFPTMSLATVYNTLSLLVDLDLIHEAGTAGDGSTRYDPKTAPHLNLVCTHCHEIIDVDEVDLSAFKELARQNGFNVTGIKVMIHGLCGDCQQEASEAE